MSARNSFVLIMVFMTLSCSDQANKKLNEVPTPSALTNVRDSRIDTLNKYMPALLEKLKQQNANTADKTKFINLFRIYCNLPPDYSDSIRIGHGNVPGDLYLQISELSKQGFKDALIALMKSSIGWYGRTVEGSEFHNELLWNIYQQKTKLTLQALSEIDPSVRREIMEKEYQAPLLDYNYIAILDSMKDFEPQESFVSDFSLLRSHLELIVEGAFKH